MAHKNLYSVPQEAILVFNSGAKKQVEREIKDILGKPYLKTKHAPLLVEHGNSEFKLKSASLYSLVELLLRSQTIQDLRLKIASEDVYYESSFRRFCDKVPWANYLPEGAKLDLRIRSVGSRLFHETMLKDIVETRLSERFKFQFHRNEEDSLSKLYIDLHENVCSASLSLAGNPLYQRGFRDIGGAIAPLREDIAQNCLREGLSFCQFHDEAYLLEDLWVPFGGTGTFVFEAIMNNFDIAPCLLRDSYALEKFPFFNEKNFSFVRNKAASQVQAKALKSVFYSDYSQEVSDLFKRNFVNLRSRLKDGDLLGSLAINIQTENFFTAEVPGFEGAYVFTPINPPYGLRLHSHTEIPLLYKKVGKKLIEATLKNPRCRFGGFILCPSEESWSDFLKIISPLAKTQSYHLNQGGLDIRVCQFLFHRS